MGKEFYVEAWEEEVIIPTYEVGLGDKNPMFLEKRVYQGSSGKVYPYPVIDKIYDVKVEKSYKAVFLENEYLKIMILPELGGRIQRAYDKTNGYDFVYYNEVIKPALVGLAGPWISGGIEFNWPQHHRPNTYGPVEYLIENNCDGSKTVWVSEIDRMYGTKGMAGFTLYPGKAYLEINGQLYNRTDLPQTFLWWANPAVPVNENTQSIFPPDVHAVLDHGKRDVSTFPIATGTYYKMDYSKGVDISKYKNIPVPTSYMAYKSKYDFVGGYDYGKQAGLLHVANHHISPGKKQWTWGNGKFGESWDRNLTDNNGPYIELMTGVFTDNQPDFTWLQPNEEKVFKQYFLPYKNIGEVKKANINIALSLDIKEKKIIIGVYATSEYRNLNIILSGEDKVYIDEKISLNPSISFNKEIEVCKNDVNHNFELTIYDEENNKLISYVTEKDEWTEEEIPDPAKAILSPEELENNEDLYLAGMHLEQYRHATYEPENYYLEGLKRNQYDLRINNAYGKLLLRRGDFINAEKYFRMSVKTLSRHNSNPYDSEPFYNLGLALKYQGKIDEAYSMFYKSVWEYRYQANGYYSIAQIDCLKNDLNTALEHIDKSLVNNYHNMRARLLKATVLRKLSRDYDALAFIKESKKIDILDFGSRYEEFLLKEEIEKESSKEILNGLITLMRRDPHNYITLAKDYINCGFYEEAKRILCVFIDNNEKEEIYPMIYYYLGYSFFKTGELNESKKFYLYAMKAKSDYCFPNSIEDLIVLQYAIESNNRDGKAYYYLGNLYYDKKQYDKAIMHWEKSTEIDSTNPTTFRNLALAYYNKSKNVIKANEALEKSFDLNRNDARVLLELDQLYKKLNYDLNYRLKNLHENFHLLDSRDDLFVEYLTLINNNEEFEKAYKLILGRRFHPWEGGEGKITKQYVCALIEMAKRALKNNDVEDAIVLLRKALEYPENLGEGKLAGAQENDISYYLGCAYNLLDEEKKANKYFMKASVGLEEPTSAMYYNDQPPEMIFYQGLALKKLNRDNLAQEKFDKLINYGKKHFNDDIKLDYFAVSLPDFLIFDEDLNIRNKIHCNYLIALGNLGKGNLRESIVNLQKVIDLDKAHQGAIMHLKMIQDNLLF